MTRESHLFIWFLLFGSKRHVVIWKPVGFEGETSLGIACSVDLTSKDGLAVTLEGHIRNRFGNQHVVVGIQRLDSYRHCLLIAREERETADLDCGSHGR